MNGKRYFLCIRRKWKSLLLFLLIGVILSAGIYEISYCVKKSHKTYMTEALFHVEANYEEIYNHYNSYTWRDVLKRDVIMEPAMQVLASTGSKLSRSQVEASLDADIVSDLRLLFVTVTMDSKEDATEAMKGMIEGVIALPNQESGLQEITLWSLKEVSLVTYENLLWQAVILGLIVGLLAWIIVVSIYYALEDSIYTISDVKELTRIPVLGYRCKKECASLEHMLLENLQALKADSFGETGKESDFAEISVDEEKDWKFQNLQGKKILLTVQFGNRNGKKLLLLLHQLELQGLNPLGIVITEGDNQFLKEYYCVSK